MSSINCGVIPYRDAWSRSICSERVEPSICWSVATSRNSLKVLSLSRMLRRPGVEFVESASCKVYWYCVRDGAAAHAHVLRRLQVEPLRPRLSLASAAAGEMIWSAVALRSARGFKVMYMRPLLSAEPPLAPIDIATLATSGSACTIAPNCCCSSDIASNDTSCAASEMPVMRPVSCCGKNPLGITMKR